MNVYLTRAAKQDICIKNYVQVMLFNTEISQKVPMIWALM